MSQKYIFQLVSNWSWLLFIGFLILGWFYPIIGVAALVCMLAPIIVALTKGSRLWCGKLCPRGSFNDNIVSRISRRVQIPEIFSNNYVRVIVFIGLMSNFIIKIVKASSWQEIGFVFYQIISITTILAILLGVLYRERTWCAICPIGSLSTWIIKLKKFLGLKHQGIEVNQGECVECTHCEQQCPLNLSPHQFHWEGEANLDCVHCDECIEACPVNALDK